MLISELVNLAKYSELSGVSAKDDINAVVAFINLGLLELYGRFPIKTEEHVISLEDGEFYYDLPKDYMYTIQAFGEVYIDFIQHAREIGINDPQDDLSIFTTNWNKIQVPYPATGSYISLIYASKPTPVTVETAEDGTTELDIPFYLVDPLLHYIGYKGHLGIRSDAQSENNAHWARFERSCNRVRNDNPSFFGDSMEMPSRIHNRGFA